MSSSSDNSPESGAAAPIVVVGGGISGLTAAYDLQRLRRERGIAAEVVVLEASERTGGTIETARADGFTMERGPDSIVTDKPQGLDLCRALGLEERLVPTDASHRGSFIARGNRLLPVPEGFHLLAPSRLWPFAASDILSWSGKLRVAADMIIPAKRSDEEESLAAFVRRRLGREALDRIAQPMVGGIYTADPERLSLAATMPRFIDMERRHGSLIRAMLAARRTSESSAGATGPRYELFVSLQDGLEELPRALVASLPPGTVRTGVRVAGITRSQGGWRLRTNSGPIEAQALCLAVPAYRAAELLRDVDRTLADELAAIPYASSATVNLTYRRQDVPHPLDGFGFVVPAVERRATIACSFSSVKYAHRAPSGMVLLRAFVGGALAPQNLELDDEQMVGAVTSDLGELLGVRVPPLQSLVSRYERSMPQYHVGHLARVARIEDRVAQVPGLGLAGNAYRGTGIPDCIRSGMQAAAVLIESLRHRPARTGHAAG